MTRLFCLIISLITAALLTAAPTAASSRLVADLSNKSIAITTGFHGTELLLFGAVDGRAGDDIIVIVTGPPTDIAQRRKDNRAGIWVNVETNIWKQAPSFYNILATRPLDKIASIEMMQQLGIGPAHLGLTLLPEGGTGPAIDGNRFIEALAGNMGSIHLWPAQTGTVSLAQDALFRATLDLPANIVTGDYDIRVLHFRDGMAISEDRTRLNIEKGGLTADIYNLAHDYSALYGIFAIAFAVAAGWLAAAAFRRN
jgi:uncharacterized protein (TIGR02186 family)